MNTQTTTTDELFVIAADSQRRAILRYLRLNGATAIDSLIDELAGENTPADDATISIRLYHTHLPRLTEAGLVTYDPATRQIEPNELAEDRLGTLLESRLSTGEFDDE